MLSIYLDQFTELCTTDASYALCVEGLGVRPKLGETMDETSNSIILNLLYHACPKLLKKLRVLNVAQLQETLELEKEQAVQAFVLCSLLHHPKSSNSIYELDAEHGVLICQESFQK